MREIPPTAGLPSRWGDFLPNRDLSLRAEFAQLLQIDDVQIECSGTAALIVTLTALARLSARRSIIIPAYTCPLVALAIAHCGLKTVLCDLRKNHFDLCPQALASLCGEDTLAVVPTHLGGRVADLDAVIPIARRAGAAVIEDAAQSLGGYRRDQPLGVIGDVGFYSLAVGKGLTLYEGGVLMARDTRVRQILRDVSAEIVSYRPLLEIFRLLQLAGYTALYRPAMLGWAYGARLRRALKKGDVVKAVGDIFPPDIPLHSVGTWRRAIGARALRRLPAFLATLSAQAVWRKEKLATIPGLVVMDDTAEGHGTWPYFMVLMPTKQARDAALARLWSAGLGVSRLFIHALPDYSCLAPLFDGAGVPNARDFAARLLTVSNSPWLREQEFLNICTALEACVQN